MEESAQPYRLQYPQLKILGTNVISLISLKYPFEKLLNVAFWARMEMTNMWLRVVLAKIHALSFNNISHHIGYYDSCSGCISTAKAIQKRSKTNTCPEIQIKTQPKNTMLCYHSSQTKTSSSARATLVVDMTPVMISVFVYL